MQPGDFTASGRSHHAAAPGLEGLLETGGAPEGHAFTPVACGRVVVSMIRAVAVKNRRDSAAREALQQRPAAVE